MDQRQWSVVILGAFVFLMCLVWLISSFGKLLEKKGKERIECLWEIVFRIALVGIGVYLYIIALKHFHVF